MELESLSGAKKRALARDDRAPWGMRMAPASLSKVKMKVWLIQPSDLSASLMEPKSRVEWVILMESESRSMVVSMGLMTEHLEE